MTREPVYIERPIYDTYHRVIGYSRSVLRDTYHRPVYREVEAKP